MPSLVNEIRASNCTMTPLISTIARLSDWAVTIPNQQKIVNLYKANVIINLCNQNNEICVYLFMEKGAVWNDNENIQNVYSN